jgi:multidrug efflux system outer membrane protein
MKPGAKFTICFAVAAALSLCACKVGPNYKRPALDVPGDYRGVAPSDATQQSTAQPNPDGTPSMAAPAATPTQQATGTAAAQGQAQTAPASQPAPAPGPAGSYPSGTAQTPSSADLLHPQVPGQPFPPGQTYGDTQWASVFQDEVLQGLIKEALANNYDMRIAATRVLQAEANLGIVRANQFPTINGTGSITYGKDDVSYRSSDEQRYGALGLSLNYVVDFWGQYRRATEAARAQLLATTYGKDVVQITLVASVATAYYLLGQYDDQLDYSHKTVEADQEILKLNEIKFKGGDAALTDVYQAQVILQQAEASVYAYQQLVEQTENALSILLGRNPGPIKRGLNLVDQPHEPEIPAGLPSDLLRRRPDIREAEEALVAANANVGVAKAAFFPQFSITGALGTQSLTLTNFLSGPSLFWAVGGGVVQPIYQGGRIRANYRLAWAQRDQAELEYKQTVQRAFADVSNSLIGYQQSRQYRMKLQQQTQTYSDLVRLSNVRYQGGYTSFLEVQYNEQQYFQAALLLSAAWYQEMQYYASLYQALGGGWQVQ